MIWSDAPPLTAEITTYRTVDGWRSGVASLSDGTAYEFFQAPDLKVWLYVDERASRGTHLNDVFNGFGGRRRRGVREALARIPVGTAPW